MTPEEREALVKARLFFFRSGTLASALFGKGKRDLDDEMTTLYEQMLDFVGGNSESLNAMLSEKYDSLVLGGNWNKLASAFAGTSPPYTQSELSTDMKSLYASYLSEFIDDEEDVDELDFKRFLKRKYASLVKCGEKGGRAGTEWVSSIVTQRKCFPHIDDFGEFLQAVLTLEEDGTLSPKDEKMFARFGNTLKSSYALSKCLDNDGSLPQSNCQELYQSLETIFAEGFDLSTNQRGIGSFVDNRWQQFLERHKQVPGIKDLSEFRKGQQVSTYAASHGLALVDNAPMQTKKKKVVW